jgi:CBS domain containing-hemolysin-like protein
MRNNFHPRSRPFVWRGALRPSFLLALTAFTLAPAQAHASLFQGEALDTMANVISWVAIIVAPIVLIGVFWMVHIIPEKVAEKKKHPQAKAIQVLCLLSLFFGGLLWPLAWLWAYSKPVLHKLAYGHDVDESHGAHPAPEDDKKGGQS